MNYNFSIINPTNLVLTVGLGFCNRPTINLFRQDKSSSFPKPHRSPIAQTLMSLFSCCLFVPSVHVNSFTSSSLVDTITHSKAGLYFAYAKYAMHLDIFSCATNPLECIAQPIQRQLLRCISQPKANVIVLKQSRLQ